MCRPAPVGRTKSWVRSQRVHAVMLDLATDRGQVFSVKQAVRHGSSSVVNAMPVGAGSDNGSRGAQIRSSCRRGMRFNLPVMRRACEIVRYGTSPTSTTPSDFVMGARRVRSAVIATTV